MQDTIISLRSQLEEIKKINLDMYVKLQVRERDGTAQGCARTSSNFQECEADITRKGELVAKLESRTRDISRMLERLSKR